MAKLSKASEREWSEWVASDTIRNRHQYLSESSWHLGVGVVELPPGCNTGTAHFHMKEEEHVLVLDGQMEVRLDDQWHVIGAGDHVCFEAGDEVAHKLRNPFETACRYFLIGERDPDDVIVYPDTNQVLARSLREVYERKPIDYVELDEPGAT